MNYVPYLVMIVGSFLYVLETVILKKFKHVPLIHQLFIICLSAMIPATSVVTYYNYKNKDKPPSEYNFNFSELFTNKNRLLVEILMGILIYIILNKLNVPQSILLCTVFSCFMVIAGIDYKYLLIPRSIIIILFVALIIKPFIFEQSFIDIAFGSVLLMLYMSVLIFFVGIIKKNFKLIGLGDIILLIMIGGWFGVINSYICLFISSVIGISITKIPFIKYHNDNKIPFGFCLSASFIIVSLLVDCYKIELFTF